MQSYYFEKKNSIHFERTQFKTTVLINLDFLILFFDKQELQLFDEIHWVGNGPPVAEPKCGFRGKKCISKFEIKSYVLTINMKLEMARTKTKAEPLKITLFSA